MEHHPPRATAGQRIHQHAECYYASGASTGYEVYLMRCGDSVTFTRMGDGGFMNWAFDGRYNREDGSNIVHFY